MRRMLFAALALVAAVMPSAQAAEPDLSMPTLLRLDDKLWAAGDDWRPIFDRLPIEQKRALLDLNAISRVEVTKYLRPRACEDVCGPVEQAVAEVAPPAGGRPVERYPGYGATAPLYECDSLHGEVNAYSITGRILLSQFDSMTWCVDALGAFAGYSHDSDAGAYGWGWNVGTCVCQEFSNPPTPDSRQHTFFSNWTYHRQVGLGPFIFVDSDDTWIKGSVTAVGPHRAFAEMTGD